MQNLYSNPVVLKVINGTQRSDVHLCRTCSMGHHIQAANSGFELIRCMRFSPLVIQEPIARCSHYLDRTRPSLQAMEEIAWSLMTDKGGRSLGFLSPEELRRREPNSLPSAPTPGFGA